ncbi:hypothetical protein KKA95_01395 [Patescibacteria group bacterium]|nr:hypothetical protein [Patescibacteria group bacterium]
MASEEVLKQLFAVAKASSSFAGMSDNEVWGACLAYKDRSDGDIKIAISNIRNKDRKKEEKAQKAKEAIEKGSQTLAHLKEEEGVERQEDALNADKVLEEYFNS